MDASTSPADQQGIIHSPHDEDVLEAASEGDEQENHLQDENDEDRAQQSIAGPMQKRRRVTRACDECRRKKIKCDGKQPCTHCTVYSYECTYDQPSNRRRTAAPQYIEALEVQLKRAKGILSLIVPTLDLNDASIDAQLQHGGLSQSLPGPPSRSRLGSDPQVVQHTVASPSTDIEDHRLESMIRATDQLDLDEDGNWDYHGHSSGLSFMRRIQQELGHIIGDKAEVAPLFPKRKANPDVFDSPSSGQHSPFESASVQTATIDLPPRQDARSLCDNALLDAAALLRVVHLPTFYASFDRMYEINFDSYDSYDHSEHAFLPLLYSVLALGTLFPRRDTELDKAGYDRRMAEGHKYLRAARQLLDIADCRDLVSLQAVVFMTLFLQSSARLSTCYSYIGVAMRSALRMGLHRSLHIDVSPVEAETRKRLFWVIQRMDIYVGAMLGLPTFLNEDDIDQDYPLEVDDDCITDSEIRMMPPGAISVMAASNAHVKIVLVLRKICKYVYPTKATPSAKDFSANYSVGYTKIREIEQDMQGWLDELPMALKPGGEAAPIIGRVQQLLRMGFAHAQLQLYRPFLHYVSRSYRKRASVDQRAFACATACISVSRNIIHIVAEMQRKDLLIGAYWFSMYTTFFAIMSLLYFVLENPESVTSHELFRDAVQGKELLQDCAERSQAAERCSRSLNAIFERLPASVIKVEGDTTQSKKRRQRSPARAMRSRPQSLKQDPEFVPISTPRRVSTFPESLPAHSQTMPPLSQAHLLSLGQESPYNTSFPVPSLIDTPATLDSISNFGVPTGQDSFFTPSIPDSGLRGGTNDLAWHNIPLSDMSTMMFPSEDPMAYPNQPMTTFEHNHSQSFELPNGQRTSFETTGGAMKRAADPYPTALHNVHAMLQHPEHAMPLLNPMPIGLMDGADPRNVYHPRSGDHSSRLGMQQGDLTGVDGLFRAEQWRHILVDQGFDTSSRSSQDANRPGDPLLGAWQ